MVTKRKVLLEYGLNSRSFDVLVDMGVIRAIVKTGARNSVEVDEESLRGLVEGQHFVICRMCGAYCAKLTTKHLRACSGISLGAYRLAHPTAAFSSEVSSERSRKTPEQRAAQSKKLKERFATAEGETTRQQIVAAARRLQQSGYRERAAEHLRALNRSPEQRERTKIASAARWQDPEFRASREKWCKDHRAYLVASAARARRHLQKVTKPHRELKRLLLEAGLAFESEFEVGVYAIDEADSRLKIAVEVDGCYWHGCEKCRFVPFGDNARRDKAKNTFLKRRGWRVLRIKTCALRQDPAAQLRMVEAVVEERAREL